MRSVGWVLEYINLFPSSIGKASFSLCIYMYFHNEEHISYFYLKNFYEEGAIYVTATFYSYRRSGKVFSVFVAQCINMNPPDIEETKGFSACNVKCG